MAPSTLTYVLLLLKRNLLSHCNKSEPVGFEKSETSLKIKTPRDKLFVANSCTISLILFLSLCLLLFHRRRWERIETFSRIFVWDRFSPDFSKSVRGPTTAAAQKGQNFNSLFFPHLLPGSSLGQGSVPSEKTPNQSSFPVLCAVRCSLFLAVLPHNVRGYVMEESRSRKKFYSFTIH